VTQSGLTGNALPVSISSVGIITIRNDDEANVTIEDVSAKEDDGPITLTAILDNEVEGGFEVDVVSIDGTATSMDDDYTSLSQTLAFAGTAGEAISFELSPTSDDIVELSETLTITMVNLDETNLDVTIDDQAMVTLVNDDTARVSITTTMDAQEDATNGLLTISSDKPIDQDVALSITVTGDAVAGVDYETLDTDYLLPLRTTELTITVVVLDDNTVEPDETVTVSLDMISTDAVIRGADQQADVTIIDDDHLPVITVDQTFTIDEDAVDGAPVGTIEATDEDAGTTFADWTIVSGNDDDVFSLDGTSGAITVANSTLLDFVNSPTYTLTVTVSDGTNTSEPAMMTIEVQDASVPTITLTSEVGEITNQSPIEFTLTASEVLIGLEATDMTVTNGAVSNFSTANDITYTFVVTPGADGMVQVSVAEGVAADAAGNATSATAPIMFFYDATAPVATLSSTAVPLSKESTATVQIDFPEMVSGLTEDDFSLSNAQITSLTGADAAYTLGLSVTEGVVNLTLQQGAVTDPAGNENPSASITWEVDLTTPTVNDVEIDAQAVNSLNEESLDITVDAGVGTEGTFTYVVTGSNGTTVEGTGTLVNGQAVISNIDVSSLPDGNLEIEVTVTDEAGNVSDPVTSTIKKDTMQDIPQGFSPDGDGIGDTWVIPGIEDLPNNVVTIFNRYGTKVWETTNYDNQSNAWDSQANVDGIFGAASLPDGTYFYVIEFPGTDIDTKSGFVILKR